MTTTNSNPTGNTDMASSEYVSNRLAVNKARREQLHGREHVVVPMSMIVPGVLNGSKGALYYPIEEVQKDPTSWNGMPITVGHPVRNGKNVSARDPEVLDSQSIGTVLKARTGDKLRAEAWIDVIKANKIDPRIIENIDQGRKTEISTGLYTDNTAAPDGSNYRGKPYQWIARNYRPDHLAILVDQRGACSVDDGCGLGVNSNPEGHNQYTASKANEASRKASKLTARVSKSVDPIVKEGQTQHSKATDIALLAAVTKDKSAVKHLHVEAAEIHSSLSQKHLDRSKVTKDREAAKIHQQAAKAHAEAAKQHNQLAANQEPTNNDWSNKLQKTNVTANSNPEGHNQYTHGSKFKIGDRIHVVGKNGGVVTRQGTSKVEVLHDSANVATLYKHDDKRFRSVTANSNPEGHNQYTLKRVSDGIGTKPNGKTHDKFHVMHEGQKIGEISTFSGYKDTKAKNSRLVSKRVVVVKYASKPEDHLTPGEYTRTVSWDHKDSAMDHIVGRHQRFLKNQTPPISNQQEVPMTQDEKKQLVIELTANEGCGCWQKSDRKHLMTLSDERLLTLKASHEQEMVDNGGPGSGPQKRGAKHLEQHLTEGDRVKIHPAYGLKGVHTITTVHQDSSGRRTHAVVQKGSKKSTISTADISHHESAETGKRSKIVGNSQSVYSKQECKMLSEKANNSSALAEKSERETDHERAGYDHEEAKNAHMNHESGPDTDTAAEHSKKAQSHFSKSKANDNEKPVSTQNQQGERFVPNENSGQMTEEQFMAMAPASIQETINNAAEIVRETKKTLIDKLTANMQGEEKTRYVAYLSSKPLPEVRQLVALVANAAPAPATQVQPRQSVYGPTGGSVVVDNRAEDTDVLDMTPSRIDWKTLSASNANNRSRN